MNDECEILCWGESQTELRNSMAACLGQASLFAVAQLCEIGVVHWLKIMNRQPFLIPRSFPLLIATRTPWSRRKRDSDLALILMYFHQLIGSILLLIERHRRPLMTDG